MDSTEVAQCFTSFIAGSSHIFRAFSVFSAFSDFGFTAKISNISFIFSDENGKRSAISRGQQRG